MNFDEKIERLRHASDEMEQLHPKAIFLMRDEEEVYAFGRSAKVVIDVCLGKDAGLKDVAYLYFMFKDLQKNIDKLISAGYRVALCDQLFDKKTIKRD